jgi:hypothetical protein
VAIESIGDANISAELALLLRQRQLDQQGNEICFATWYDLVGELHRFDRLGAHHSLLVSWAIKPFVQAERRKRKRLITQRLQRYMDQQQKQELVDISSDNSSTLAPGSQEEKESAFVNNGVDDAALEQGFDAKYADEGEAHRPPTTVVHVDRHPMRHPEVALGISPAFVMTCDMTSVAAKEARGGDDDGTSGNTVENDQDVRAHIVADYEVRVL